MTTVERFELFTRLPDEESLAANFVPPEEDGFSVDIVTDFDDAREAVLARIPEGSSVMTRLDEWQPWHETDEPPETHDPKTKGEG